MTTLKVGTVVQSGVRFRAYPHARMATTLRQWIGCQRVVYNAKVEENRLNWVLRNMAKEVGPQPALEPHSMYSQFKNDELTPWLSLVPSQILRNGVTRWRDAMERFHKGLSKAPTRRNRYNFTTVTISSELFRFVERINPRTKKNITVIELGTRANPVGILPFRGHRAYNLPKTLSVRCEGQTWHVSFCYEHTLTTANAHGDLDDVILRQPHELAYELNTRSDEELLATTLGLDRNVRDNMVATSDGTMFTISEQQAERMRKKDQARKRFQRGQARCQKGSKNSVKLRKKISSTYTYGRNVRQDTAHQISRKIVASPANFIVAEKLNITGMTKRPAPKQDEHGTYLTNGARAKAALTQKILNACWGNIVAFTKYKAARVNKLLVTVDPRYTSQECSRCEHIHPDNRPQKGPLFSCVSCGFTAHADVNAAKVIAKRGIKALRSGMYEKVKTKKSVGAYKKRKVKPAASGVTIEDPFDIPAGGQPVVVCGEDLHFPKMDAFPVASGTPSPAEILRA